MTGRSSLRALALVLAAAIPIACRPAAESAPSLPGASLSLFALGDTGQPAWPAALRSRQLAVAKAMTHQARTAPVHGIVFLGDQFYPQGLQNDTLVRQMMDHIVAPYCAFLRLDGTRSHEVAGACGIPEAERRPVPLHAVLGNHDYERGESPSLQLNTLPAFVSNWRLASGLVERRDLGHGVDLLLLDSERAMGGEDLAPLRDALIASPGPLRILALHRPVAAANGQWRDPAGAESLLSERVRAAVSASGRTVSLVLSGHVHNLQLLVEPPPLALHVVAGGGGGRLRPVRWPHASRRFGLAAPGFARIDLVEQAGGARLVVSLFRVTASPLFVTDGGTLVARISVDAAGEVHEDVVPQTEAALPDGDHYGRAGSRRAP